jgi:hypothetical protein
MADESEEFEFRMRLEKEQAAQSVRRSPKMMTTALNMAGFLAGGGPIGKLGREGSKSADEASYKAGGAVTDFASKMGASPAVSGGAGLATNVALQSIPALASGAAGARVLSVPLAKVGRVGAEELMGSALKPSTPQWLSGEGKAAVDTMLEKGLNVSKGGILKLHEELEGLQKQVSTALENSNAKVPKADVVKTIQEAAKYFKGGTSETQDLKVIKAVINEFEKAPSVKGMQQIPVQVAQRMKQLEYRKLDKAYGTLGDAEETARKGTARGLKEGIEKAHPEIKGWNAEEQKIFKTLPVVERRAMMEINRNPGGLALLTHDPAVAAVFMGDKSSLFKSWLANRMNQFAQGGGSKVAGAAAGVPLSEIGQQR